MMKERYSIGETAKLFNISVQTLRFYEKMGLIAPEFVNPKTGYRYYSREQFHYIDRIQYLKGLGITLREIKDILISGKVDSLQFFLHKNLSEREQEMEELKEKIGDLKWYIQYFDYMDSTVTKEGRLFVATLEERYMLAAPCIPTEPFADIEDRLVQLRSRGEFGGLRYRRHYSFIIDYEDMLNEVFSPTAAAIFLKKKPDFVSPYITTLPAGEYLCFSAILRMHQWNSSDVLRFFKQGPYRPVFAIANEYEDNLVEYTATPYEIQVFLSRNTG